MKGEWRYVSMDSGGQYVMMHGITLMHKLCVDSWDIGEVVGLYMYTSNS